MGGDGDEERARPALFPITLNVRQNDDDEETQEVCVGGALIFREGTAVLVGGRGAQRFVAGE
jgi:hypothetical protein